MRKSFWIAFPLILFAFGSGPVMADTVTTFDVTGTFDNGASLSGTMEIDRTIGKVTNDNLVASAPDVSWTFPNLFGQNCNGAECVIDSRIGNDFLILSLHIGTLIRYTVVRSMIFRTIIIFRLTHCLLTSGKLATAPVATPEPSSLASSRVDSELCS